MSPSIKCNRDIDSREWCYNRGDARGHRIMPMRSLIFAVEHRQSRFDGGVLRNSAWICWSDNADEKTYSSVVQTENAAIQGSY